MNTGPQNPQNQGRRIRDYLKFRGIGPSRKQSAKSEKRPKFAIPVGHHDGARGRYKQAVALLKDALEGKNEKWGSFEIPKLAEESENMDPLSFKKGLQSICETYSKKHDRGVIEKCAHAIEWCFTASAVFVKNALEIATEGSAVAPPLNFKLTVRWEC